MLYSLSNDNAVKPQILYYRTIGHPWLVISIPRGNDAMARAMLSGNNALIPKWRPTAVQESSWLQETVFNLYSSLNCEVLCTAKVIASVLVYFYRALAVKGAGDVHNSDASTSFC
jgi:hypothetical protein